MSNLNGNLINHKSTLEVHTSAGWFKPPCELSVVGLLSRTVGSQNHRYSQKVREFLPLVYLDIGDVSEVPELVSLRCLVTIG